MKKMVVLSLLALVLAAASEQQASAYFKFNIGACVNLGFSCAPSCQRVKVPLCAPQGFYGGQEGMPYPGIAQPEPLHSPAPLPPGGAKPVGPTSTQQSNLQNPWNSLYQPVNYFIPMFNPYAGYGQ